MAGRSAEAAHGRSPGPGELVLREVLRALLRGLVGCLGGLRVEGAELVPRSGGVLIAPNHRSHLDPVLVGLVIRRPVWFIATDELFAIPVLGRIARALRAFPIHQDSPDRWALRRAEQLLRSGEALVSFPEGHESLNGRLQPLQGGCVFLALRAEVPILPVGILGSERVLPPWQWRLRHGSHPILVRFGQPLAPDVLSGGMRGKEAVQHGTALLRQVLLELTEEAPGQTGSILFTPRPRALQEPEGRMSKSESHRQ